MFSTLNLKGINASYAWAQPLAGIRVAKPAKSDQLPAKEISHIDAPALITLTKGNRVGFMEQR